MNLTYSLIIATSGRDESIYRLCENLDKFGYTERDDLEIIIVDNNFYPTLMHLANDFNVIVLHSPDGGKSSAQNAGIAISQGKYLVFTDDDIEVTSRDWLEIMKNVFDHYPDVAYVSANVKAARLDTESVRAWEKKGGLSKGNQFKYFDQKYLSTFKLQPWPLTKILAGANCMFRRDVLLEIGCFTELLGSGTPLGHGETLEVGYRLIKSGYSLAYTPDVHVLHHHRQSRKEVLKTLFLYGRGDTALHMFLFLRYLDFRSLYWVFPGHQIYLLKYILKWFIGKHPMSPYFVLRSLLGSVQGGITFVIIMTRERKWRYFFNLEDLI